MAACTRIPPEVWIHILQIATHVSLDKTTKFRTTFDDPLSFLEYPFVRIPEYRPALTTKVALVQVCKQWRAIAIPILYEVTIVNLSNCHKLVQSLLLEDGFDRCAQVRYLSIEPADIQEDYPDLVKGISRCQRLEVYRHVDRDDPWVGDELIIPLLTTSARFLRVLHIRRIFYSNSFIDLLNNAQNLEILDIDQCVNLASHQPMQTLDLPRLHSLFLNTALTTWDHTPLPALSRGNFPSLKFQCIRLPGIKHSVLRLPHSPHLHTIDLSQWYEPPVALILSTNPQLVTLTISLDAWLWDIEWSEIFAEGLTYGLQQLGLLCYQKPDRDSLLEFLLSKFTDRSVFPNANHLRLIKFYRLHKQLKWPLSIWRKWIPAIGDLNIVLDTDTGERIEAPPPPLGNGDDDSPEEHVTILFLLLTTWSLVSFHFNQEIADTYAVGV